MNIIEAIKHCQDKTNENTCPEMCKSDHARLALWLEELIRLREDNSNLRKEIIVLRHDNSSLREDTINLRSENINLRSHIKIQYKIIPNTDTSRVGSMYCFKQCDKNQN